MFRGVQVGLGRPSAVVVLAAGEGTRMKSSTPKVLHEIAGRPLVGHVLAAAHRLAAEHTIVVVGHGRERVTDYVTSVAPVVVVVQEQQNGTGHAVRIALEAAASQGADVRAASGPIVVVAGDTPLLSTQTLSELVDAHVSSKAAATVLTAILDDPTGYGRVIREGNTVAAIVEHKDANDAQRAVNEINSGVYAFDPRSLVDALSRLTTNNAQGEEYLTDVLGILRNDGKTVTAVVAADSFEILGVNDRVQLAQAGEILRQRINTAWMREGVTIVDPTTTWIGADVVLERDVTLLPNTMLLGTTRVESGSTIGPDTTLIDTIVGADAHVRRSEATNASIGDGADVGPFTYLRAGTVLADHAKVGAYVEIKNSTVGEGSKVPHLSYVGDATIGTGTNIGAATVFVNYDGVNKHQTVIGDHVRIGSDTMLVAPVTVEDGAYTAAGSVITDDVPAGAMAVARERQRNIEGWVERRRAGSKSADAAKAARERMATTTPNDSGAGQ